MLIFRRYKKDHLPIDPLSQPTLEGCVFVLVVAHAQRRANSRWGSVCFDTHTIPPDVSIIPLGGAKPVGEHLRDAKGCIILSQVLGNTTICEGEAMPKAAPYMLVWSPERACYELYAQGSDRPLLRGDDQAWLDWLEAHNAFAFQGRSSRLNLLKESRKGGAGYWYAY